MHLIHQAAGHWWAAAPREEWPTDPAAVAAIERDWDPRFGDRRQELVFIGIDMNAGAIERALARCLLTDEELAEGAAAWARLDDPFAGTPLAS